MKNSQKICLILNEGYEKIEKQINSLIKDLSDISKKENYNSLFQDAIDIKENLKEFYFNLSEAIVSSFKYLKFNRRHLIIQITIQII
jgi:hypothetical protein